MEERVVDLKKLEAAVHKPMDYSEYASSYVESHVNCYTHAIGATSIHMGLRIGEICGKKPILKEFVSDEEIKELFLADMQKIHLVCREIDKHNKWALLKWISKANLDETEAVVMLFVQHNSDGSIRDFHFWRYDSEKGYTEKRFWHGLTFNGTPEYSWPESEMNHFIGAYLLKR